MANDDWKIVDQASVQTGSLLFDDAFFPALKDTNITLRRGALAVASGPFNFVAKNSGEVLPVIITGVEIAPFNAMPDEVFTRDGKGGRTKTFNDMRKFYPDLKPESQITALSYKLAPSP